MLLLRRSERNVDASNKKQFSALLSQGFGSDGCWTHRSGDTSNPPTLIDDDITSVPGIYAVMTSRQRQIGPTFSLAQTWVVSLKTALGRQCDWHT